MFILVSLSLCVYISICTRTHTHTHTHTHDGELIADTCVHTGWYTQIYDLALSTERPRDSDTPGQQAHPAPTPWFLNAVFQWKDPGLPLERWPVLGLGLLRQISLERPMVLEERMC